MSVRCSAIAFVLFVALVTVISIGSARFAHRSAPSPAASAGAPAKANAACATLRELDGDISVDDIFAFVRNTRPTAENALIVGRHGGRLVELLRKEGIHVDVLDEDASFVEQLRECTSLGAANALVGRFDGEVAASYPPHTDPPWPGRTYSITILLDPKVTRVSARTYGYLKAGLNNRIVVTRWIDADEHSFDARTISELDFPRRLPNGSFEHMAVWEYQTFLKRERAVARERWPVEIQMSTRGQAAERSRKIDVVGYLVRTPEGDVVLECPSGDSDTRMHVRIVGEGDELASHLEGATFAKLVDPTVQSPPMHLVSLVNTNLDRNWGMNISSVVALVRGSARLVRWSEGERVYEIRPTAPIRTISARDWEMTYAHYEKMLDRASARLKAGKLDEAVVALREAKTQVDALVGDMARLFEVHRYIAYVLSGAEIAARLGEIWEIEKIAHVPVPIGGVDGRYMLLTPEKNLARAIRTYAAAH